MNIKKSLAIIFTMITVFIFSQEKIKINGKVLDKNKNAIAYSSLLFNNLENKLYNDAALTDEKGIYNIDLMPGKYKITIEAINFKQIIVEKTITNGKLEDFVLDEEEVKTNTKTKALDDIVIVGKAKQQYKIELDKK